MASYQVAATGRINISNWINERRAVESASVTSELLQNAEVESTSVTTRALQVVVTTSARTQLTVRPPGRGDLGEKPKSA
jgi:hypothetical protein